jgi:hypothetical protein
MYNGDGFIESGEAISLQLLAFRNRKLDELIADG